MRSRQSLDHHLGKFRGMDAVELGLFLHAWILLCGWWVRIRIRRLPDHAASAPPDGAATVRAADAGENTLRDCQLAVQRAENYHFLNGNCLLRSLALHSLLRSRGVDSRLRLGVRPGSHKMIEAHAWVEVGALAPGRVIPGEPAHDPLRRRS